MADGMPDDGSETDERLWRLVGLQHFAILFGGAALAGRSIDETALQEIAAQAIRDFRDNKLTGIAVQPEAKVVREAIGNLEQDLDYIAVEAGKIKLRIAAGMQDVDAVQALESPGRGLPLPEETPKN